MNPQSLMRPPWSFQGIFPDVSGNKHRRSFGVVPDFSPLLFSCVSCLRCPSPVLIRCHGTAAALCIYVWMSLLHVNCLLQMVPQQALVATFRETPHKLSYRKVFHVNCWMYRICRFSHVKENKDVWINWSWRYWVVSCLCLWLVGHPRSYLQLTLCGAGLQTCHTWPWEEDGEPTKKQREHHLQLCCG